MNKIKRTERGWGGHFCCAHRCLFRRNTLITYNNLKVVVSTVGLMYDSLNTSRFVTIGIDRYYETMAFYSKSEDTRYNDADVSRQIYFTSPWTIDKIDADDEANDMHETVCDEIETKLMSGELL